METWPFNNFRAVKGEMWEPSDVSPLKEAIQGLGKMVLPHCGGVNIACSQSRDPWRADSASTTIQLRVNGWESRCSFHVRISCILPDSLLTFHFQSKNSNLSSDVPILSFCD